MESFQQFSQAVQTLENKPDGTIKLTVINDGSTQAISQSIIKQIKQSIPDFNYLEYPENQGKGHALRTAVSQVESQYIILTDIDFPYTNDSMLRILKSLQHGQDIATGYREQLYYQKVPLFRKWLSQVLRWVLRNALRLPTDDSQCGLKGFNQKGKEIFLKTSVKQFLYDLEFLMMASRKKDVEIKPVPVQLKEGVVFTKVNVKTLLQEGINFIKIYLSN